jgi:protein-S-isoprenylcysteine O-methyltransferase Ste14
MINAAPLARRAALVAVYAEKYVLSPVYLYIAWREFVSVSAVVHQELPLWHFIRIQPLVTQAAIFSDFARSIVALLLNLFTGLFLLLGSRPAVPPQKLRDVLVPLAAVSLTLAYDAVPWFPAVIQKSLSPASWRAPLLVAGLFLGVIGPAVAVWSLFYLRRSFGIFVVVRKIVLGGPYRWVRHPMYAGYICMLAGLVLMNFSIAYFIIVPVQFALLMWRARLEETRLAESSAEYQEYRKRTGFIFPKFLLP